MIVLFVHWKREKKDVRNYIRRIKKMIIDNVYVYTANNDFCKRLVLFWTEIKLCGFMKKRMLRS